VAGVSLADIKGAFEGKVFPYLFAVQKAQATGSITVVYAATARGGGAGHGDVRRGQRRHRADCAAAGRRAGPRAGQRRGAGRRRHPVVVVSAGRGTPDPVRRDGGQLPVERIGRPDDVAAIAYVIEATYVTGAILPVDGGFTVA
jgi:hypothetical protein